VLAFGFSLRSPYQAFVKREERILYLFGEPVS
jgi:hypothetical protein